MFKWQHSRLRVLISCHYSCERHRGFIQLMTRNIHQISSKKHSKGIIHRPIKLMVELLCKLTEKERGTNIKQNLFYATYYVNYTRTGVPGGLS